MLTRRTPWRAPGWKTPKPATQSTYTARPRETAKPAETMPMTDPIPKQTPWRSKPYRKLVASQPCEHCGIHGYSQAAHGDMGKGMATKTGDETCYALCGPHMMNNAVLVGCHELMGRQMSREARRYLEAIHAQRTRARLRPECERLGIKLPEEPK